MRGSHELVVRACQADVRGSKARARQEARRARSLNEAADLALGQVVSCPGYAVPSLEGVGGDSEIARGSMGPPLSKASDSRFVTYLRDAQAGSVRPPVRLSSMVPALRESARVKRHYSCSHLQCARSS